MKLNLITAPLTEPVSLADIEGQLQLNTGDITSAGQASTVTGYLKTMRGRAESITRRQLVTAVYEMVLESFPINNGPIELPRPPLQSVQSIKYYDTTGTQITLDVALYRVLSETSPKCRPGLVVPAYGQSWPSTRDDYDMVTIQFTAGYSSAAPAPINPLPQEIIDWIKLNVGTMWAIRESQTILPGSFKESDFRTLADSILYDFKVFTL